jgi:hypothetical protein
MPGIYIVNGASLTIDGEHEGAINEVPQPIQARIKQAGLTLLQTINNENNTTVVVMGIPMEEPQPLKLGVTKTYCPSALPSDFADLFYDVAISLYEKYGCASKRTQGIIVSRFA